MQLFKRIGATIFVVIIVFTIVAPCFSTPVAIDGIDIFTALYNAYLVSRGVDAVGSSNDAPWTVSDPASSATWRDLWQQNFDYYASQVDQTVTDVDAWVAAYIDQLDAQVRDRLNPSEPPEDPNDNGVIGLQFTAQLTEFFDKFTNLIFKDKYNLTNDGSGFVHSSGTFADPLSSSSSFSYPGGDMVTLSNGYFFTNYSNYDWYLECTGSVFAGRVGSTPLCLLSPISQTAYVTFIFTNGNVIRQYTINCNNAITLGGVTYYYGSGHIANTPVIANMPELTYFPPVTSDEVTANSDLIHLSPSDRIGSSPIPVPDTDDEDYVPAPLDVPLNVPWRSTMDDPDFSDDTDPAAEAIIDAITGEVATNTLSTLEPVTPDPPLASPSPVMPPFLPSEPPPFNFNFSGIWYYVVRWVNSMLAGMGWFANIWSNIPAAMFYPVFGTAVVVIVLGVWRRFVS